MRLPSSALPFLLLASWCTAQSTTVAQRFPPPPGTVRATADEGSFGAFLRQLPLKPVGAPVLLHDGSLKARQDVHAAVIDLSVGDRDLQQCADAVIRLRAEYLLANGRQDEIAFDFTNGFRAEWKRWRNGERIQVKGAQCRWIRTGERDSSRAQLLRFLETVFMYAGTMSLSRELRDATAFEPAPGDVFIRGGSPGHAMIVVDVARAPDGRTYLMLAQSYMPAQEMHILRNPAMPSTPWHALEGDRLRTPEWTFDWNERKRWP